MQTWQTCCDNGWYVVTDTTARFCSMSIATPLQGNSLSLFCSPYDSTKQKINTWIIKYFNARWHENINIYSIKVTKSWENKFNPLAANNNFSQRALWCWENQHHLMSSAKNTQSNDGWPLTSPVFCTVHWAFNSCTKGLTFRHDLLNKEILVNNPSASVVPKMWSADPSGSVNSSQGDLWIYFCNGYSEVYWCFN